MPKQKLFEAEWGLWNNSWVKNLPVRPLAPRRKTPVQLNPSFYDLPGLVSNKLNLCSFGLNVFPFITTFYLPTIKKQTKHF